MATQDSVQLAAPPSGADLRDRYWDAIRELTLGIAHQRDNSVVVGPVELLRFGDPQVTPTYVDWPIEGGLLAGAPGGHWRIQNQNGTVVASVEGYRPRLPRPLYVISHLQVHLLFTRLFLLRLHGRTVTSGKPASLNDRKQAATIDIAFCLTIARLAGLGRRRRTVLGIIAGYHIACWSISGRTLGGLVVGQRVVSVDGRSLTPAQSVVRLLAAPLSWIARRPVHDAFAGTEVITE